MQSLAFLFITDMKNGRYSIQFARNESIRISYYNQDTLVFKPLNDKPGSGIISSDDNSILLPPNFDEFKDCMDYLLNLNSTYIQAYVHGKRSSKEEESEIIDPTQEVLKDGIECQFLNHTQNDLKHLNFTDMTLIPSNTDQCTWLWLPDKNKAWGGVFNVTLRNTPQQITSLNNDFHQGKFFERNVMIALTCTACITPPCSIRKRNRIGTDIRVTYALPFILQHESTLNKESVNVQQDVKVLGRTISIIISTVVISFVLLGVVVIVTYQYCRRREDKR